MQIDKITLPLPNIKNLVFERETKTVQTQREEYTKSMFINYNTNSIDQPVQLM